MTTLDESNNREKEYQVYLEERKQLIEAVRESSQLFDKSVLTLAAGALGLSLTFIRQITPSVKQGTIYILVLAWLFFCLSILSTLISFLTSKSACLKQIHILEEDYFGDRCQNSENKLSGLTTLLNVASIISFFVGTILLAIFSAKNLVK